MEIRDAWLKVFPIPKKTTSKAVEAITECWHAIANHPKSWFNHKTVEPDLTLQLTKYLRDVCPRQIKLLGRWSCEDNEGFVDPTTGKLKRIRTDIGFHWHDNEQNYSIIFEFKRLNRYKRSLEHYYGEKGMQRFVTGEYGVKHPLAFMVGILIDDWNECVEPLRTCLQQDEIAQSLKMCTINGNQRLQTPSALFPEIAAFDTEHRRDHKRAPKNGTIRISHIFLPFGYANPLNTKRKV